jgi:transcription antitermination factor NusG
MLLTKGKVASSEPWKILEVAINQAPEVIALRLQKELKRIHEPAVQALVPFRRNSDGDPEWIVEHVYVRGANGSLRQLARVPGIDFIRREPAEPWWILQLLEQESTAESSRVKLGDFVRVLSGPCARLCGHVTAIKDHRFTVTVAMRTKKIRVHTFAGNLQPVECPSEQQVFFYRAELLA